MSPLSNLAARDVETLVHPYINLARFRETGPLVIERGQGVYVYDTEGKPYLEGMAGLWCTALGYGNEELVEAAATQMRKLSFAHLFTGKSHDPAIELGEKLKEIAPVPISKVFFCNSGSEANDTQVKLVWYLNNALGRPRKKKIVSRMKAYHGVTVAAASLTGLPGNHRDFDVPLPGFLHAGCPHHYRFAQDGESEEEFATRLAAELDALIVQEGPDTVAGFIAEPVMGAGGVIVPPRTYFEKIMAVCARHDVFTISDEVICGFGRLGTTFGCEKLGFAPQSISIAKALSSAYLPIAGVMIPEDMYQALLSESRKIGVFGHGFTYGGHPVSAAVALKAIEIYQRDRIFAKAAERAPQFQARLAALGGHPLVGEARGLGLIGGVELVADRTNKRSFDPQHGVGARAVQFAEAEGLIVRSVLGDVLTLCPPLVISEEEIGELFDRLGRALDKTLDWVTRERLAQS
jgi:4-aminobutyrate--pyruvate transaminase